jgi:hypothetical protein
MDSSGAREESRFESVSRREDGSGDPTVSVDLLVKSLLAAGADREEPGRVVGSRKR